MELFTVKLPKGLIDNLKTLYDKENVPNREFLRTLMVSNLPQKHLEVIANEYKVNLDEVKKLTAKRREIDGNIKNKNEDKNNQNKKLQSMLEQSEFTNHMILAYVKLLLMDTGYSFPSNIEERLSNFNAYDQDVIAELLKRFEED